MDGSTTLAIPHQSKVAFSWPVDPCSANYENERKVSEQVLACTVQVHQCGSSCLCYTSTQTFCKCWAPFPLADEAWVDVDGNWGPKQSFGFLNNWNLEILQSLQVNHDIKLLTNRAMTKMIAWYITNYAAKSQHVSFNTSTLLTTTLAFHQKMERKNHNLSNLNKKMIQHCANTLSWDQELSGPEVVSYLMGWGDRYISHHFETVPLFPLVNLLQKQFPELNDSN